MHDVCRQNYPPLSCYIIRTATGRGRLWAFRRKSALVLAFFKMWHVASIQRSRRKNMSIKYVETLRGDAFIAD